MISNLQLIQVIEQPLTIYGHTLITIQPFAYKSVPCHSTLFFIIQYQKLHVKIICINLIIKHVCRLYIVGITCESRDRHNYTQNHSVMKTAIGDCWIPRCFLVVFRQHVFSNIFCVPSPPPPLVWCKMGSE